MFGSEGFAIAFAFCKNFDLFTTCFHGFMRPNSKLSQSSCRFDKYPKETKKNTHFEPKLLFELLNVSQIPIS